MPPGESPELLERGRGAAQLPGGQQDGLVLRHLLKGTAHACAEVWHITHGHSQLGKAEDSAGYTPNKRMHWPIPPTATSLTCTPGDVTDTLLGRTRTWTHLLSSSAKPCGAEAPGQAPSRQHLHGVDSGCLTVSTISRARPASALGGPCPGLSGGLGRMGYSWPSPQCLGPGGPGDLTWGGASAH